MLTIAILAQGEMGAGIAGRLSENGVRIVTVLEGRSAASKARAASARMENVAIGDLSSSDFFLSILPPGQAQSLANDMANRWTTVERKPVYVDCNAVSPRTAASIAETIAGCGATFIDAGIIGGPPKPGAKGPAIYASGKAAGAFAALKDYGLDIRVLDGAIGAASALKMSYAGITKGMTAIGAAMMLAATREGAGEALRAELEAGQPALFGWLARQTRGMIPKAYRWVSEMEEISEFQQDDQAASEIYRAIAHFYERIASDERGDKNETDRLRAFLK